jgi:hypothetical protein
MIRNFAAYLGERFRPRVFVPAILGLTGLAIACVDARPTAISTARALVLMGLLVLQFRVWDDLEDRERDRRVHPYRVLVRAQPAPFWWAMVILAFVAAQLIRTLTVAGSPALTTFFCLIVAGFMAYRVIRDFVSDRAWSHWILLAKYPAFVAIVALAHGPVARSRLIVAAAVAFAAAHLYERVHTRTAEPGVPR